MHPYEPPLPGRESTLTVILTGMVLTFSLGLLILISGGWVLWLVIVTAAMVMFGCFHYLLWGKLLSDKVAGEREEEKLLQRASAPDWPEEKDTRIRKSF